MHNLKKINAYKYFPYRLHKNLSLYSTYGTRGLTYTSFTDYFNIILIFVFIIFNFALAVVFK